MQFFLDLNRAFDSVDSSILLRKLECCGVRGSILLLISSYLGRRKQFVSFGGYESTCEKIEVGVLAPLLFLIYIYIYNLQSNTSLNFLNFADSTML